MAKNKAQRAIKILKKEYSVYLKTVAQKTQDQVLSNFDNEEDVNGNRFAPLKDFTRDQRERQGYGRSGPILKRTNKLRKGLKCVALPSKETIEFRYSVDYAEYLNDGRDNMDERKIIEMPDNYKIGGSDREVLYKNFEEKVLSGIADILKED